jgi:subtilase family serine protease
MKHRWRTATTSVAALAAVALGIPALSAPPPASAGTSVKAGTIEYAVLKPLCARPKKLGVMMCFSIRREIVKKGTKGARPFTFGDGSVNAATIGPAGGLTPLDFKTAYNLPTTGGAGQTVAIVDWFDDPTIVSDLATFDTNYGLPVCNESNGCLKVVNQSGAASPLPATDPSGSSEVEESLDVETVHSVCQGCKIILVEANSGNSTDLTPAENYAATHAGVVSNSFGGAEGGSTPTFQAAFNHPGVAIVASTGDDGYYTFDQVTEGSILPVNQPNAPASYSTVIAAGGTSLYLNQSGGRQSETVWNDNGPGDVYQALTGVPLGASGGGCSTMFTAQPWQSAISGYATNTACGTRRLDADMSADADPFTGFDVYDTFSPSTGWQTIGGTSLASPLIAAAIALAGGAHGVAYPSLTLYGRMKSFYDVTAGGSGACGGEGAAQCGNPNSFYGGAVDCDYNTLGTVVSSGDLACDAAPGYDGASGVGTPNGLTGFTVDHIPVTLNGPTSVVHGTSNAWSVTAGADPFPGGKVNKYVWAWGDGTPNTTTTVPSAAHTYAAAGSDKLTVTISDQYLGNGSASETITVS